MPAVENHIDRIALPRSLVGRRRRTYVCTWKFRMGAIVEFHGDRGMVLQRTRTAMGRELYLIWFRAGDERPYRWVLGSALKHVH